ncbi:DUF3558 domain-containing protein [Pseudonocardia sp. GCM10023141]|uniref:DUF3558 domain-containing protein n=1 Tax=Pseudonocardia sp. GCM10023141 TaxID=3252653 RepID=UPI0036156F70
MLVALLAILATLTATACSPAPAPPSAPATESWLPPRPRELPIDGLDPCTALTEQQRVTLELGRTRAFASPSPDRGPACTWIFTAVTDFWSVSLETSPHRGATSAIGSTRATRTLTIAGFPAVETSNPLADEDKQCFVIIDVAAAQALVVDFTSNGDTVAMNHALACSKANLAAEQIMQTLLQQTPG